MIRAGWEQLQQIEAVGKFCPALRFPLPIPMGIFLSTSRPFSRLPTRTTRTTGTGTINRNPTHPCARKTRTGPIPSCAPDQALTCRFFVRAVSCRRSKIPARKIFWRLRKRRGMKMLNGETGGEAIRKMSSAVETTGKLSEEAHCQCEHALALKREIPSGSSRPPAR